MFGGSPGDSCAVAGSHKPVGRTRKDGTDLDPEKGYRGNAKRLAKWNFAIEPQRRLEHLRNKCLVDRQGLEPWTP